MTAHTWATVGILVVALVVVTRLLGAYLAWVYGGPDAIAATPTVATDGAADRAPSRRATVADRADAAFHAIERVVYRVCGIDEGSEQRWSTYARSLLAFSLVSVLGLYGLQRLQRLLPLNPTHTGAVTPALA